LGISLGNTPAASNRQQQYQANISHMFQLVPTNISPAAETAETKTAFLTFSWNNFHMPRRLQPIVAEDLWQIICEQKRMNIMLTIRRYPTDDNFPDMTKNHRSRRRYFHHAQTLDRQA
jgi:hypothetical protein